MTLPIDHVFMNGSGKGAARPPSGPMGEVVESSTTAFLAQACVLHVAPPLGSFVEVAADDVGTVLAVVAHVETAGLDPSARPILRGHDDVRDGQIYLENPDLPHVLRTTFRALVVGFGDAEHGYHQFLPSLPPRLHYSVQVASPETVRVFTDRGLDYFRALLAATDTPTEEVVAANVRLVGAVRGEPVEFARRAGRELAQLLRADYARLSYILRRMLPLASGAA